MCTGPNNPYMSYSSLQSQVWSTKKRAPLNDHAIPYSMHHDSSSVLSGKDKWNWVILWRIPHSCNGSPSLRNGVSKIAGRRLTRKRLYKPLFPKSNNKKEMWSQTSPTSKISYKLFRSRFIHILLNNLTHRLYEHIKPLIIISKILFYNLLLSRQKLFF